MSDQVPIQYWDSCLFINFLTNQEKGKAEIVKQLLDQAQATKPALTIAISDLVLAEVRPSEDYRKEHRERIEELFETDREYIRTYAVTRMIANRAREIGVGFPQLSVPDTIHIATALEAGADVFFTYDGDRDATRRRSGDLLRYDRKIGEPALRIEVPWVSSGPLDEALKQISGSREGTGSS